MPTARRERVKFIMVIFLSLILILVGYFRFFHGKMAFPIVDQRSIEATPAQVGVPVVDTKGLLPERKAVETLPEPLRTKLRDIFAPWKEPVVETRQPTGSVVPAEPPEPVKPPEPPKPIPSLILTGTIVGGNIPLAFINGRSLKLGDRIEGFQIIAITREQVTLMGDEQKVQLNVVKSVENDQQ